MANCGVCSEICDTEVDSARCTGECEQIFHVACLPADTFKKRGSKNTYLCELCKKDKTKTGSSVGSNKVAVSDVLTKEFFMKTLEAFKSEISSELRSYHSDFQKLEQSLAYFSDEMDRTASLLKEVNQKYTAVKKENAELRQECASLRQDVLELRTRMRNAEQYSRKNNIEIAGVPQTKEEDVNAIIQDVGKAIGVTLKKEEVVAAHRVPSYKSERTPSLIVQFSTRVVRDTWVTSFKRHPGLTANQVNRNFKKTKIFVNEHLTPENKLLLSRAKEAGKKSNFKFVWCKEGKIFARKAEGDRCVRIDSELDLDKLK